MSLFLIIIEIKNKTLQLSVVILVILPKQIHVASQFSPNEVRKSVIVKVGVE